MEANYRRGISVDIVGVGTVSDFQKEFEITEPTRIVVRKDSSVCGEVAVSLLPQQAADSMAALHMSKRAAANGDRLRLIKGDRVKLLDVVMEGARDGDVVVNFLGFVGNKKNNTGEDRGYVIDTARDLWARYSKDGSGRRFSVTVSRLGRQVREIFVYLEEPREATLQTRKDKKLAGQSKTLPPI